MSISNTKKSREKEQGHHLKYLSIQTLIFTLPILAFSYLLYSNKISLNFTRTSIVSFSIILALAGIVFVRYFFERYISIADFIQEQKNELESRTAELYQINDMLAPEIVQPKAVEGSLSNSEARSQFILQGIEYGYFEVDLEGNFNFLNNMISDLFDHSKDDLMGTNIRQYLDKEDSSNITKAFKSTSSTGLPFNKFTFELEDEDASTRYLELTISLMKDQNSLAAGYRGLIRDITEKKMAAVEKKQLETQFYVAQKMESIGTLAGGIAHNFNNLLMGIQGNISLLRFNLEKADLPVTRLENIDKLVESGSKLTSQLLGFAKKDHYRLKPFDVNHLLEYMSDTFSTTRKDIQVHHYFDKNLFHINADQSQIEQVLLNLMVNAADAMPAGGNLYLRSVNASHKAMSGKQFNPKHGNYVMISIKDTGSGMDTKTLSQIFEPFFTTKNPSSGTGLGLASSYGIIKGHGGYIDVESEPNQGSTFHIFLPASNENIIDNEDKKEESTNGNETILLVDDEDIVLEVTAMLLRESGYSVFEAKTGNEAIEKFRQKSSDIDAVILDMVMPNMGGDEIFEKMREIDPGVKVLLSSGYSVDGKAREIMNKGCSGFIQKPYRLKDLSSKLGEILN